MVSSCCVKGCSEKFVKGGGVSYFRISSKPEMQRNAWILALKRNGWTPKAHHRICSRHFVTGTWNSDPNHIDYIPTKGMRQEVCIVDGANNNDSSDTPILDHSILPDSPDSTDTSALGNCNSSPHLTFDEGVNSSQHSSSLPTSRVPIIGITSSQFSSMPSSLKSKPRKMSRRRQDKWSSSPKLTSNHFCEHQDSHRNCCRVIRELAEENQILKSQVSLLLYEMERLRAETLPSSTFDRNLICDTPQASLSKVNGNGTVFQEDIEVVSESPPSLSVNEDIDLAQEDDH
ncbi:uncharacterized protein [Watersipora subatra]|uniref:uncharacterized protein n=1 Tax=Watersipora subatra TaxID=2589382 RepID=UPI00355B9B52